MRCVSNVGDFVPDEECNMNLRPVDVENCDRGPCAKSWFYTEWGDRVGVRVNGRHRTFHSSPITEEVIVQVRLHPSSRCPRKPDDV